MVDQTFAALNKPQWNCKTSVAQASQLIRAPGRRISFLRRGFLAELAHCIIRTRPNPFHFISIPR